MKRFQHTLWLMMLVAAMALLVAACGGGAGDQGAAATEAAAGGETGAADVTETAPEAATETAEVATGTVQEGATTASGKTTLGLWTHSAGNENEMIVIDEMVQNFNAMQDQWEVAVEAFPQASYNDSVAAASVAGSLPCIIDMDQPTVPNFAWSGYVQELPLTPELRDSLTAGAVGTYQDKVYSLGQFDVALLIYARRSILEQYDIRIPTLDEPWTLDEFNEILQTLKDSGDFEYPIDVGAAGTGEWWPYAYSPMLQSFGGDLVDRETYLTAEGVLNGPEAVAWGEWFQNLFAEGYANPNPPDDQGFIQGTVALWYTGSWSGQSVLEAYGEDALFLPTVDFGTGPKIGASSWQWGISSNCEYPDGAWQFVEFVMQPENIARMSEQTSLIPTSEAAAALTEDYKEGGPFRTFFDMADRFAVQRPATPGYLRVSSAFEQAGLQIRDGGNVQDALDDAVDAIDRDIEDNQGYGFQE